MAGVTQVDDHTLEWDTGTRLSLAATGAVGVYTCPDCELAGTVYVDPADALTQLVRLLTVAHRDGVVVVSGVRQGAP